MKNNNFIRSLVFTIAIAGFVLVAIFTHVQAQYNYDHVNVTTTVNVTNAGPTFLDITIDPASNIVLVAGGQRTVYCNATVQDFNGFNDIDIVNATFYHFFNTSEQVDDQNEHYTNTSCVEINNDGQYEANYSCSFQVQYFAHNGTWNCNMSVNDSFNYRDYINDTTSIDILYALNVTDVIDYGNLSVTDYSENITATVTNFGNTDINVSVLGYGQTEGDGWALVCNQGDNITVDNERFYNALVPWASKNVLTGVNQDANITLAQQTDDLSIVTQNTYWQLYVPPNPFGVCTGVVRFTATNPAP